jgi:hypothetical protein
MSSKNILDFPEDNSPNSDWYVLVAKEDGCYVKVKLSDLSGGGGSTTTSTTTTAAGSTTSTTTTAAASSTTTTSTTTTAAPLLQDVIFTTKTAGVVNNSGVWDAGLSPVNEYGITSVKIPAGQEGWVQWYYDSVTSGSGGYFGFKETPGGPVTENSFRISIEFSLNDTQPPILLPAPPNFPANVTVPVPSLSSSVASIGNYVRIRRQVGGTLTLEYSTNGGGIGGTWTTVYTFTTTSVNDLYIACLFSNNGSNIERLNYPKVFNAS